MTVHDIAMALASILRSSPNTVPDSFWGFDMQYAVDGADLSSPTGILRFVRQEVESALIQKLSSNGENSADLIAEMKSSPSNYELVLDSPISLSGENIGLAVGANNLNARGDMDDNHDWEDQQCKAHYYLHKKTDSSNNVWVLNIIVGLSFDFSDIHNCYEINFQYTDANGYIHNQHWPIDEYFGQEMARLEYMKAYARWGQLAWHGWRFKSSDPPDEHQLYIFVWPIVKDASNELLTWSDRQNLPSGLFASSVLVDSNGTYGDDCRSHLNMTHFASLGKDNGMACSGDVFLYNTDVEVFHPKPVPNRTCSEPTHSLSSTKYAGNAAHEFGHLIQIAHTKDQSALMYGGLGTGSGGKMQKNTEEIASDNNRRLVRDVSMRPHILWVEKMIEDKTGERIQWVETR